MRCTEGAPGCGAPAIAPDHGAPRIVMNWLLSILLFTPPQPITRPQPPPGVDPRPTLRGEVSILADALPRREVTELRSELRVESDLRPWDWLRAHADVSVAALAGDRGGAEAHALGRVNDAWIELAGARGDLRAGYGRIVWGRLDEVQPSDVINPIDAARLILTGRSDARRAVAFVRGRLFAAERLTIEGILSPVFRRGTFDELDERSSPFNLVRDVVLPASAAAPADIVVRNGPVVAWDNMSGGVRTSATVGRVDVAAAIYRGFDGFGIIAFEPAFAEGPAPAVVGRLMERYPRFTMIAGDVETVSGDWAWRGEAAAFVEKRLPSAMVPGGVDGKAIEAGVGFDRRAGDYRVYASAIVRREWSGEDPSVNRTHLNLVGSIERSFDRDRYRARAFAVINPGDAAAFVRGVFSWSVRDNVAVEGSAAAFLGTSDDALGRFKRRDFLFTRLRYWF
jgi:hypothetical protein